MFGYGNPQFNVERINQQIQELERLKQGYQQQPAQPQQPINIYNNTNGTQNDFEARILKKDEKPEEILVQKKTAFISLENKELAIKELNGDIARYGLILPKDEKDLKIEELEKQIQELKGMINNEYSKSNKPIKNVVKSNVYDNGENEPSTKTSSGNISK